MSELKPCPFCGAGTFEVRANGRMWLGMKYSEAASVSVLHWCEATPGQPSRVIERVGRDEASAIEAWNRRAQPAQAGQLLTRHEQEDLYRETSNRVAQLEAENRYEFASWFFIAVELVEQAVRAKLGAGVPMTDPQLQTSEERRATGDRILELIEKQHPGIVGEKGGA